MDLKIRVYCGLLTALFVAVYHVQAYERCGSPMGTCRHYWDPCPKGMIPCPDKGCKLNINYCCCRKGPAVCGGPLKGTWGVFKSPHFPYYYPQYAMCEWTTYVPRKTKLILQFSRTFALAPCGDFLLISDGRKTLKITDGFKVRRCHGYKCYYNEPSFYDESANKDNGNFYNDDVDDDFYYYYDEKRNEDEDGWKAFWVSKRRRLIIVQGGNRHVIIKFKSKGCGSAKGFSVRYDKKRQKRSRGSSSSSDEEQ